MLIHVPLDQIDDNPYQRRRDYGDVESLAADIKGRGLLQIPRGRLLFDGWPVNGPATEQTLAATNGWPGGQSFRVQLAFGHRRLRAYRSLDGNGDEGLKMPVYVEHMSDDQMLDFVWSENQHRSGINPVEQAELLAEKLERARAAGGNQATVAAEWNLDRSTIANKLRLLELPAEVQTALRERRLSERQAQALLPLMELEAKLNGAPVDWGTPNQAWGVPPAPAAYVARVLAAPEAATSDAIREYTKNAIAHAGQPLGDDFAAFDAGQGQGIIQPACKGCPSRQNQTCLDRGGCFDARSVRYFDALPERAARETGLPYSNDAADFAHSYDGALAVLGDWKDEKRDGLVVGIDVSGWGSRPFHNGRFVDPHDARVDWRRAIKLGRRAGAEAAPDNDAENFAQPSADELAGWKKAQGKADKERAGRVRQALRFFLEPLMGDETALRALMAMLEGYTIRETLERGESPTPETLFDGLFTLAWKRVDTGNYDGTFGNRQALRRLLHAAAISPDVADPADRVLRLIDIGQVALLEWNDMRNHVGYARKRLGRLREALAEFYAVPDIVDDDDELAQLAVYLRAAVEREEKLAAKEDSRK